MSAEFARALQLIRDVNERVDRCADAASVDRLATSIDQLRIELGAIARTQTDIQSEIVDLVKFDRDTMTDIVRRPIAPTIRPVNSIGPPRAAWKRLRTWLAFTVLAVAGSLGIAIAEWLTKR